MEELLLMVTLSRTCAQMRNLITFGYPLHQKALTPLVEIVDSCISQFSLDYMHLACLGVMQMILHYLMKGPRICRLSQQQIHLISDNLVNLNGKLPSEFSRQPRSLDLMTDGRLQSSESSFYILDHWF